MTGFSFTINNSAQRAGSNLARCVFFETVRIATTSDIGHWFRNDRFLQEVRCKAGRVVRDADPYNAIHR